MRQIASPVGRRHAEQLISNQKLVTNESRPAENSDSTVMQHRPTPSRRQSLNGRAPTRVEQQARGASPAQTGLTKWHCSQYTSHEFAEYCAKNGIRRSLGRTGICFDNAVSESF